MIDELVTAAICGPLAVLGIIFAFKVKGNRSVHAHYSAKGISVVVSSGKVTVKGLKRS